MLNLPEAIQANRPLLGENFENLGSKTNLYLKFDRTTGWSLERFSGCLGFVQKIFRWLGFYASTHLKTVRDQLLREANVPLQLLLKINTCWQKLHPLAAQAIEPAARAPEPAPPAPLEPEPIAIPPEAPAEAPPEPVPNPAAAPAEAPPVVAQPARVPLPLIDEPRAILPQPPVQANRIPMLIGPPNNTTLFSIESGDLLRAPVKAIVTHWEQVLRRPKFHPINLRVYDAAGPALLEERQNLPILRPAANPRLAPIQCWLGRAVITRSGQLAQNGIERILHTAAPVLMGPVPLPPMGNEIFDHLVNAQNIAEEREKSIKQIRSAYLHSLELAHQNGVKTLAFTPLGTDRHPTIADQVDYMHEDFNEAAWIGFDAISNYLYRHPGRFNEVKLIFPEELFMPALRVFEERTGRILGAPH